MSFKYYLSTITLFIGMFFYMLGNCSAISLQPVGKKAARETFASLTAPNAAEPLSCPQVVFAESSIPEDSSLLWLVSRDNRLSSCYTPTNLVDYNGIKLHDVAHKAFMEMQAAMVANKIYGLKLQSAYRTYDYQHTIYSKKVQELVKSGYCQQQAETTAAQTVQPPGASEHQLGLALDVSIDGKLTQAFGETEAGIWLQENCHNYGFIIRYPGSKTEITQIVYEPWHLRYVGTPHATIMKKLDMTLEEYLSYIKEIQAYVHWGEDNNYCLIMYSDTLQIQLPPEAITASASSFNSNKNEFAIIICKMYPDIWNTDAEN